MRKFEGTCYIPGEQLAMMAKYYRGANLNLNLTLMEDEGIMKESLESSCWCSKLDDVDRMKLRHMKGDAWAIDHEHHHGVPGGPQANSIDRGSMSCCFDVTKSPREMNGVDKGTDTMSLYHHPPRRDYHDPRFDVWRGPSMQDRYDGDRNYRRRDSQRRGFFPNNNYDNRTNYNMQAYYATNSQCKDYDAYQYRRSEDPDLEDDIASRYTEEENDNDIKCAVCRKDVCAVCKNPIRGWPCRCKCVIPNAGLCNECDTQCEKESAKDDDVSKCQQQPQTENNWSNLMLLLMGSQMFNRSQNTNTSCKCMKNISSNLVGGSESSSASSSCSCCSEKVQKIFLYDCGATENTKNKKVNKSEEISRGESSGCGCCKCSKKSKTVKGKGSNNGKPSNSTARRESNESERSEVSNTPSSSPRKSTKLWSKHTNNFKPNATSSKKPSSQVKPEEIGNRFRKSKTSIKEHEESGKKGSGRRSTFKKPLVDDDNQSISSKNQEPKANKRRRTEVPIADDNKSQSSHKSEEDDSTSSIKKTKSSSDITNFLVWLPKIKSDLEQLLMKMKDEGQIATNVKGCLQPTFPAPKPNLTNVTRRNVPFITHPAADAPRPTDVSNWSTGTLFNSLTKSHTGPNKNYGFSVSKRYDKAQLNEHNKINPDVSSRNRTNKERHSLEQQYPSIFYSLHQRETTTAMPQKTIIGDECDDLHPLDHMKSNIKQNLTSTSNTVWPTFKQPISAGISTSSQVFQPSNNMLQYQQMGEEHTFKTTIDLDSAWQLNVLRPEISDASHVFQPQNNVWHCQPIGVEHTNFGNSSTLNPSGVKSPLLAYCNQNSVDQEMVSIQTLIPGRAYDQQFPEFSATCQTVQPSENFRHCQPLSVKHTKYGNPSTLGSSRQQTPILDYNEKYSVDQEFVKIKTLMPERTRKQQFSESNNTRQDVQTSKTVWHCQPMGVNQTEYRNKSNLNPSLQQNASLAFNNRNSVDQESVDIQTFFPDMSAACHMVQTSNNLRHGQQIGFKDENGACKSNLSHLIHQNAVHAYDNQNGWTRIDQSVKVQTLPNPSITLTQRTPPLVENRHNAGLTDACKQERTSDDPEDNREETNIEEIQVDLKGQGSLKNLTSLSEDFVTVKEKRSNDPMQSSGSKPTSDLFISAIEVNEQLSEENLISEREHKNTVVVDTNRLGCWEFPKQIANQSIGPGQFTVTVPSVSPGFNLSDCPPECARQYYAQTDCRKRKQRAEEHITKMSKSERQNDQCAVKNSSKVTTEGNDKREPLLTVSV
ncbi:hypothetical protein GE061_010861 [Apolygus lucorum]|uniref:Uncharacterized protein n=1 Tax=Apolygus lucorum TaxID=248454 RepID=A0A8S9XYH5_APOLU|nr:hypothetical protein GE061_010861 [Apolygus lucorum]